MPLSNSGTPSYLLLSDLLFLEPFFLKALFEVLDSQSIADFSTK